MKKILTTGLAVSLLMSSAGVFAEEASGEQSLAEILMYSPEVPALIYNNSVLGEDGTLPFISEDRMMLPFRELLEKIGASISYNEETRTVSAEKDGISVTFSLDDTYLDITKDGVTERITQDASNVIKDDTVYVPVRFISEAFDLNVGWDDFYKTAIIVDFEKYAEDATAASPVIAEYFDILSKLETPKSYTETFGITFDYNAAYDEISDEKLSFVLEYTGSVNEDAMQGDINIDVNLSESLTDSYDITLEDISLNFMAKDNQVYIKTNLIDKLAEVNPYDETIAAAKAAITADTWFQADIYEITDAMGVPAEVLEAIELAAASAAEKTSLAQTFKSAYAYGVSSIYDALYIDAVFTLMPDIYEDCITITDNGDETYRMDFALSTEQFTEYMKKLTGDEAAQSDGLKYTIQGYDIFGNGSSKSDMTFDMAYSDEYESLGLNMAVNGELQPTDNVEITLPETAIDLLGAIEFLNELQAIPEV